MIFENYNNIKLLTPKELGALLQKKERTIREMVYRGKIPHLKVGRSIRFKLDDVMEWLNRECRVPRPPNRDDDPDLPTEK